MMEELNENHPNLVHSKTTRNLDLDLDLHLDLEINWFNIKHILLDFEIWCYLDLSVVVEAIIDKLISVAIACLQQYACDADGLFLIQLRSC